MKISSRFFDCFLLLGMLVIFQPSRIQALQQQIDQAGHVGQTVRLPCDVDTAKCGDLHSIKWYRGTSRIYVFSQAGDVDRAEGDYVDRAKLFYNENSTKSELEVENLQIADEAVYKCELTYMEVREGCAVVQFINLTTLIQPEYIKVTNASGTELRNGTLIGPFTEGDEISLTCESGGGKPIPEVSWWNGTRMVKGEYSRINGANGVGTGRNTIRLTLGRDDLNAIYECRVESIALKTLNLTMTSSIEVDVNVQPLNMKLSGLEGHLVQGTTIVLLCVVRGARPSATIKWFNGTQPISEKASERTDTAIQNLQIESSEDSDGTYTTRSRLELTASRFEDDGVVTCEGTNAVMQYKGKPPLRKELTLEVFFPPIVTLSPENITVNETQDFSIFLSYIANPSALKSIQWYRDGQPLTLSPEHYDGGTEDTRTLSVKNSTRLDHGIYTVVLDNGIGKSETTDFVNVSIYFKPTVVLNMQPAGPVRELDQINVTLLCDVESGNPDYLIGVRWYMDGDLLKELPECEENFTNLTIPPTEQLCDVDPSQLRLTLVGRSFHGNYSCEGRNDAGWGPMSDNRELIVHYPPGYANLTYEPDEVVNKGNVTLTCSVKDPGYPPTTTYRWLRGSHLIPDVQSSSLAIKPVNLETKSNFTCLAYNEGGEGENATVFIDVLAPPAFIEPLQPYIGVPATATDVSISCRVECSPLCDVKWSKDKKGLEDNPLYYVRNEIMDPDFRTGDFESVRSTLVWNLTAWPGGRLDRNIHKQEYVCTGETNGVGPKVTSTTMFQVEYPPENIDVSTAWLNVTENTIPEPRRVVCSAKAYPEAQYQWYKEGETNYTKGNSLLFNQPILRNNGGNYICNASNRHGSITEKTFVNVLYEPECSISQTNIDGKIALVCTANANPREVDFTWRIKNENDTIEDNIEKKGMQSFLYLDSYVKNQRTYQCIANNSIGKSIECERDVTVYSSWWTSENEKMVIIIAVIVGSIVMALIICVIIIIVCRRKRASDKYPSPSVTKDKSKNDLTSSPTDGLLQPDGDRAFYENLPFHGMQSAPNKPITPTCSTRSKSSSRLSRRESSGYGSTRSHVGLYLHSSSPNEHSSLRLRRCRKGFAAGSLFHFYSLRLPRRKCSKDVALEEQCPKLPARGQLISDKNTCQQETELNNNEKENTRTVVPVPAPRKHVPSKNTKHTYQNVPIPITPNSQELNPTSLRHQHHYNQLTSSQHQLLTTPTNALTHHQTPYGSLHRSAVSTRSYLPRPPVRLEYQQPFHMADGVVYADLALASVPRHLPPCYRPPPQQNPTEYAILKFRDVGREINV